MENFTGDSQPQLNEEVTLTSRISAITRTPPEFTGKELTAEDLQAIEALPLGSALLISQHDTNSARFLLNGEETVAGRNAESAIFLDDFTVSRKHALFLRKADGFYVRDTMSLNGTYVNQKIIEEVKLNNGDEVRIGKYQFVFFGAL